MSQLLDWLIDLFLLPVRIFLRPSQYNDEVASRTASAASRPSMPDLPTRSYVPIPAATVSAGSSLVLELRNDFDTPAEVDFTRDRFFVESGGARVALSPPAASGRASIAAGGTWSATMPLGGTAPAVTAGDTIVFALLEDGVVVEQSAPVTSA